MHPDRKKLKNSLVGKNIGKYYFPPHHLREIFFKCTGCRKIAAFLSTLIARD